MESTSSSSSCWCCAECIQSRVDRHSAAAAAAAGDADALCNGLIQVDEHELCQAQQLCATDAACHQQSDEDVFDELEVCFTFF